MSLRELKVSIPDNRYTQIDNPPSRDETLTQWWANVGRRSTTLAQHWFKIRSMSRVCWAENARHGLVMARRLRR